MLLVLQVSAAAEVMPIPNRPVCIMRSPHVYIPPDLLLRNARVLFCFPFHDRERCVYVVGKESGRLTLNSPDHMGRCVQAESR